MPSPTIVFLNSHEDPATFMALNAYWMEFRKRNYIFTDEVERECTLDVVKKAHQSRLLIFKKLQQGYALSKFAPNEIKRKLDSSILRCASSVQALQFLSQLYPEEYQAIESYIRENDLLESANQGSRGIYARDRLNACIYLRDQAVAPLGLAHLMNLQESILNLALDEFTLGLDQVQDLFIFVYLYSQKPIQDDNTNCLEERVRAGRVSYPIKLLQFEISNPNVITTVGKKIFETIDEKSSRLQQSSIKNFREKNQDKLIELTKKTFNDISEMIYLQCVREQIPKIPRLPYGLFTPKKPGIRNFSTISRSQATFFRKPIHYLPVSKVIKSALSLIKR